MPRRRASIDIFGQWLLFVVLPALVRLVLLVPLWRFLWRRYRPFPPEMPGQAEDFYRSAAWRSLRISRMEANIKTYGALTCELCRTVTGPFHVHHVRSRSRYPELALDYDNTAVCCEACNIGMSNTYSDLGLNRCPRKMARLNTTSSRR